MKRNGMILFLASIPLLAGGATGADRANYGAPSVERRNFSEVEIQSTLKALGITPSSTSQAVTCDVENFQGIVTKTVGVANYPLSPVYWLRYQSGSALTKQVRFVVAPLFTGSPLAAQVQVYNPNSTAEVLAPFAIPFWGNGLTAGPWVLAVQNDSGQSATFSFTVQ